MEQWTTENPTTSGVGDPSAAERARDSVEEARAGIDEMATRGSESIRNRAERAREALSHRSDQAAQYVQEQPLKSLLMAAAAGAAIAMLAGALGRHHGHH